MSHDVERIIGRKVERDLALSAAVSRSGARLGEVGILTTNPAVRRLAVVHGLASAADAFFTVSLADSLFFSLSLEAARPRLFLYLAMTMAPFAVLAPLIGPFIGRVRGGQRSVLVATNAGRAALALALVNDFRTLWFFPEALGVLVLGKAYSVARSATVPGLVRDEDRLVATNAMLARVSIAAGAVAGGTATGILSFSSAGVVLYCASGLFLAASVAGWGVRLTSWVRHQASRLEYDELHAALVVTGLRAMGLLRAAAGALIFLLAFAFKRDGAPVWQFGVVLVCSGSGAFLATLASDRFRRRYPEERILFTMVLLAALAVTLGALQFNLVTAGVVSTAIGFAASGGKHAFDSLAQRSAPDADLAHAFAGFEARLQLYWIVGASAAIITQAGPRAGLAVLALLLGFGAVSGQVGLRTALRFEERESTGDELDASTRKDAREGPQAVLAAAEDLLARGSVRAAVIVAAAALDAHADQGHRAEVDALVVDWGEVRALRSAAISGEALDPDAALRLVAIVRRCLEDAPSQAPVRDVES